MIRKILITVLLSLSACLLYSQQVNVENILSVSKNKPVSVNGGVSLGSVFYNGNEPSGRQPWTYYLNGNMNVNIYGLLDIPVSINLTNLGTDYSYPSLPNRLSLHPSYKWITAHIGDISMVFSPYTLNGHQFTGAGVDLTPGKFKISAMGGRLLKEVPFSMDNPSLMPTYKRIGYGTKVQYDDAKYSVGMIYFGAKEFQNEEMVSVSDSLGIYPMQNSVFSWNVTLSLIKNLTFAAEYGLSILTRDTRAPQKGNTFVDELFALKTSTNVYDAFNAKLNYQLMKNTIGIAYERIDPEYQTLGAYYFNNDYENITLNYSRPFLKQDKANVAISFGIQRDNLDNTQAEENNRYVASVNLNYNPTEAVQMSLNYSTFQSYRNLKSQFDYINEISPYDNLDTLQFTQLSQNLDASVMYTFQQSETKIQRLSLNASYQETADKQGGITLSGDVSRFLNALIGYGLTLVPRNINIQTSVNGTYNYAALITSYTVGPMFGITSSFLDKTVIVGLSTSYNVNLVDKLINAKVLNCRANATYRLLKKHNFTASIVWQNRALKQKETTNAVTSTVSYSYSF
jgi:hypothetical protein